MEADIFEMVVGLYRRWLGHEGHDIIGPPDTNGQLFCRACGRVLSDLTTDWNAMGRLMKAVHGANWTVETGSYPEGSHDCWVYLSYGFGDERRHVEMEDPSLPLAVCRAVAQIPED